METIQKSSECGSATTTDKPEIFRSAIHCESLLTRLWDREDLFDVELLAGSSGKRISAHRLVLIASCHYFSALLSGPMRESQEREIILKEVDGDSLEIIVKYFYTGSLELRRDTVESLIITANYLQFNEITKGCCAFLQRQLESSNCFDVFFFAEQLNLEELLQDCKNYICDVFEEVSECPKLLLLNAKQMNDFLASDELDVSSEEVVFQVLIKWIEHEPEDRRKHFTELLAHVRLHLLPPNFLLKTVKPLCNTAETLKFYVDALKPKKLRKSDVVLNSRRSKRAESLVAVYKQNRGDITIVGYNIHSKQWSILKTLNDYDDCEVAMMDDNLIIIGGDDAEEFGTEGVNTKLNLKTMVATEMRPLNDMRGMHSVGVLKGCVYVVGGFYDEEFLSSVERWDPETEMWEFVASMKCNRGETGVGVLNDRLYVSGGNQYGTILTLVECYDPVENTWRYTAPMLSERSLHSLVGYKGYLFAIGGGNGTMERYDPTINQWSFIYCSQSIYNDARCASLGSHIYIYNNSIYYMMSCECNVNIQVLSEQHSLVPNYAKCIGLFRIPIKLK